MARLLTYYKELSKIVGEQKISNEKTMNSLEFYYKKITEPQNLFECFCNRVFPRKKKTSSKEEPIIYPFGFNISQKQAVELAIDNPLSIIEGPPGTGKTQTILNIIANALIRGYSIAVVSNNNSAIGNVEEKLQKYGFDFFCAKLGSKENKEHFIANQKELPYFEGWKNPQYSKLSAGLKKLYADIDKKLSLQNQLQSLKGEYSSLKLEGEYFLSYFNDVNSNVEIMFVEQLSTSKEVVDLLSKFEKIKSRQYSLTRVKVLYFFACILFWKRKKMIFYKIFYANFSKGIDFIILNLQKVLRLRRCLLR